MESAVADDSYQREILPHVSRTFALTIPQLPAALRPAVTSAYLLCRIADTIEDEPAIAPAETLRFLDRFKEAVAGRREPLELARELGQRLTDRTLPTERDLVSHMDAVIRMTGRLSGAQREAIVRCVDLMCYGMPRFQSTASVHGLARARPGRLLLLRRRRRRRDADGVVLRILPRDPCQARPHLRAPSRSRKDCR